MERLIDRDKLWDLFVDHFWDTFQKDRDLILCHIEAVMRMIGNENQTEPTQRRSEMSFVERELEKIEDAIRNTSDREKSDALRLAQCALRWATDPDCFMSPSNYLTEFHGLDLPPTDGTGITLANPIAGPVQQ